MKTPSTVLLFGIVSILIVSSVVTSYSDNLNSQSSDNLNSQSSDNLNSQSSDIVIPPFFFDRYYSDASNSDSDVSKNMLFPDLRNVSDREILVFINHAVMVLKFDTLKDNVLPDYYDVKIITLDDGSRILEWTTQTGSIVTAKLNDVGQIVTTFSSGLEILAQINDDHTVTVTMSDGYEFNYKFSSDGNFNLETLNGDVMQTSLYGETSVTTKYSFDNVITTKLSGGFTITELPGDVEILISSNDDFVVRTIDGETPMELSENMLKILPNGMTITSIYDNRGILVTTIDGMTNIELFYGVTKIGNNNDDEISMILSDGSVMSRLADGSMNYKLSDDNVLNRVTDGGVYNELYENIVSNKNNIAQKIIKSSDGTMSYTYGLDLVTALSSDVVRVTLADGNRLVDRTTTLGTYEVFEVNGHDAKIKSVMLPRSHSFTSTPSIITSYIDGNPVSVYQNGVMYGYTPQNAFELDPNVSNIPNFESRFVTGDDNNRSIYVKDSEFILNFGTHANTHIVSIYGFTETFDDKISKPESQIKKETEDPDPDKKTGGKDPLVFGDWRYHENDGAKCNSNSPFDFDNDGWKENFCYVIIGDIFVVDFGDGITSGANMLNFDGTTLEGYTPIGYLKTFPDTCDVYDCYLWRDSTMDWIAEPHELTPFSFEIESFVNYPDGIMRGDYPPQGMDPDDNGRYRYCEGTTTEGLDFYCLQPTYWMKGTTK